MAVTSTLDYATEAYVVIWNDAKQQLTTVTETY